MLQFSSTVSNQIRFLLQSFNDTNIDYVSGELCKFIDYGIEGSILVLQTCLEHLNCHKAGSKNMQLGPVFALTFKYILDKPNFSSVFCQSLKSTVISEGFLQSLSNALDLSAIERIDIGLSLSESENLDIRMSGKNFCMAQIEELCANSVSINSAEKIQNIIMFLRRSGGLSKHVDSFMHMLSLVPLTEGFILAPLLSDELREGNFTRSLDLFYEGSENDFDAILAEMDKERSTNDLMMELGYGCTVNASQCKEIFSLFLPLTEATLSRILGTIARTHAGLEDHQNAFSALHLVLGDSIFPDLPLLSSWNIDILVDSIKQLAPGINWIGAMENLDHEGFYLPNEESFFFFMSVYRLACQEPFPLHAICGSVWKNAVGQLSFLKHAVSAPPEVFTFAHSGRQLAYIDAVHAHKFQLGHANHAWLCLDLLDVLCQLAERGHVCSVRSVLEYPLKNCPEVLLLGMAHINTAYNLLQYEVLSTVFPMVFGNATGNGTILYIWNANFNLVLRGFIHAQNVDPDNMIRILDICEELKILSPVLEMIPFPLGIRLAAMASRKELVDLEYWLQNNLSTYKDSFFEECLKFLKEIKFGATQDVSVDPFSHSGATVKLYLETSSTFLKVLQSHTSIIASGQLCEEIEMLHGTLMHANSKMQSEGATDFSASAGYGDDIEAEANSYFHQMFSGQLTIDAMVQMLSSFKESSEKREQSIFGCVIANLFEEYRFFPKYPERQLKIAAVLFGYVIRHQLVTHLTLGVALRAVLDALRKPADSKMFVFGTKALEQFVDRLIEWPQYCNHILLISHLRGAQPELVAFIERALARISSGHSETDGGNNTSVDQHHGSSQAISVNMESIGSSLTQHGQQTSSPPQLQQRHQGSIDQRHTTSAEVFDHMKPLLVPAAQPLVIPLDDSAGIQKLQNAVSAPATLSTSPSFIRPSRGITSSVLRQHSSNTGFGSALNIETLVAAAEKRGTSIEAPASEIQDKISFIINNLSAANIDAKSKEFIEILKEQYYPWFAQYMVMKRASIEPNYHDLYLKFLDKVNSKAMNKEIVQVTYENCKVLLGSELIKSSSEERSLLKNLGSWLGKFTIGRNQVLRAREIDPKSLVIEAYEKGRMIAVIPFTSKILESCQSSLAYQPPNPWTMGILGLLAEIYAMPNLKMNLKFDIEVLFKNLGVDLKDVTPTTIVRDRIREVEGNPDFSNKDVGTSQAQVVAESKSGTVSKVSQIEPPLEVTSAPMPGGNAHILSQYAAARHLSATMLMEDEKLSALGLSDQHSSAQRLGQLSTPPKIGSHVIINPLLSSYGLHLHFERVTQISIERAIKDIVDNVVQRSVSIATKTTKELVLKDYAGEPDENHIYNAAHLMVASLAGSLAHVTCKEPLRGSISNQLRTSLQNLNIPKNEILEQAVLHVTNDNLDLGCAVIEQAATNEAIQSIDVEIAQQLSLRRKRRDGVAATVFDPSMYAQGPSGIIPEAVRPKSGSLSVSQQRVYEDFVRLPWQNQSSQNSSATPTGLSHAYGSPSEQLNTGTLSFGSEDTGSQPLDFVSEEMDSSSVQLLSTTSTHTEAVSDVTQHHSENVPFVAYPSTASTLEVHSLELSNATKESGAPSQPLPPSSATERFGSNISGPLLSTRDALDKYQIIAQKLDTLVTHNARESDIQGVVTEVHEILFRCSSRDEAALAVAQKVFKGLYENASSSLCVGAHLAILASVRDICKLVVKELTSWVIYSDEERKFNKSITVGLIRSELLNLAEYNLHMAKLLDGGRNKVATQFAISLLQTLAIEESRVISELHNLIDTLTKVATRPGSPESLQQLIEIVRSPVGVAVGKEERVWQPRDKKDPDHSPVSREDYSNVESVLDVASFREKVSMLFAEWYRICELPSLNDASCTRYIIKLQQNGLLKGDDISDRFFCLLMELSVAHCLSSEVIVSGSLPSPQNVQPLSFLAIDIYAKLVYSIMRYCPAEQGLNKIFLLSKVLQVTVRFIQKDAEEKKTSFNPRPYFRLIINWLQDLCSLDPVFFDGANFPVLMAFANAFQALQPLKAPAFSFAWLELVSNRSFMPKLLTGNPQKGWPLMQRLLVDLFQFLEPFLRNAELSEPVQLLYKGTLRVLLVLLHDFPEFLCDYHFTFCDVIPPSCIQLRNIILSAFPRNMRLPDPSTPNLKIDLLAEISQSPRILSEVDAALKVKQMKSDIDEYLKMRPQGSSFLTELKQRLLLPANEAARAGTRYNVPLMNSLVLYVGMQAIQQLQARTPPHVQPMSNPWVFLVGAALDIFQILIADLDSEGRYLFLNAVANQLRYPNNHTHYFSFILLHLFADSDQEIIQEQITRVLLERLIANRPHPWGLLITFLELIKNPRYNFWNRSFIRCAPEIEKLFESVSRSIGSPKPVDDDSMVSNWPSDNAH